MTSDLRQVREVSHGEECERQKSVPNVCMELSLGHSSLIFFSAPQLMQGVSTISKLKLACLPHIPSTSFLLAPKLYIYLIMVIIRI